MKFKPIWIISSLFVFCLYTNSLSFADSKVEIDSKVSAALEIFYETTLGGKELAAKAAGM